MFRGLVDVVAKRDNLHAVTNYRVNRQEGFAKGSGALCAMEVKNSQLEDAGTPTTKDLA